MRARNIKPALFKNELLGAADPLYTILFEGLWCMADRQGRLEDRPARIRAEVFPYRASVDIEACLRWLHDAHFIDRYRTAKGSVVQVMEFAKHQKPHRNEPESTLLDRNHKVKGRKTSTIGGQMVEGLATKVVATRADSLFSDSGFLNEERGMMNEDTPALQPLAAVQGLDEAVWARWVNYRKRRKPAIKPISMQAAAMELASFGEQQSEVVQYSIANGYQGLVAPDKRNGTGKATTTQTTKFERAMDALKRA